MQIDPSIAHLVNEDWEPTYPLETEQLSARAIMRAHERERLGRSRSARFEAAWRKALNSDAFVIMLVAIIMGAASLAGYLLAHIK